MKKIVTSRGVQPGGLRRRNVAAIAATVFSHGPLSRAEIAQLTGLSPGSVTKITAELVQHRFLAEFDASVSDDPGRPRVPLGLDPSAYRVVGMHIGLRWTTAGLVDLTGRVVTERVVTHDRTDAASVLTQAGELLDRLQAEAGDSVGVLGAGVMAGGWVDPAGGTLVQHPSLGWEQVPLREPLARGRDYPVLVDGMVRTLALAETYFGAARGVEDVVYLFVGNIVGAAFVANRRILVGHRSAAGTADHLPVGPRTGLVCPCGRRDCLYALGSDLAVLYRARQLGCSNEGEQLEDLVARSDRGEAAVRRLLRERAKYVGAAAGLLFDLFDPAMVVFGGGVLQTPEHVEALVHAAGRRATRVRDLDDIVVPTALREDPLVQGAASLVLDAVCSDPLAFLPILDRAQSRL